MKRLALIFVCAGLLDQFSVLQGQGTCTFPGKDRRCRSLRGTWEVEWREARGDARHVLWLKAVAGGTRQKLLEFDRSTDLLWSPDERALAVTDHAGSNESDVLVFTGPSFLVPVGLEDRLRADLGALPEIFENGHRYFEAADWLSDTVLRFRVRAHDREPGKEYRGTFRYVLGGRVSREPSS